MSLDESTRRAWKGHFATVAADYRSQARLAMRLARTAKATKERARWTMDARRLNRAARHLLNFDHGLSAGGPLGGTAT